MNVVFGGAEYPAYIIDPVTLREEPLSPEEMREWCEETPNDPNAVAFWRMLGELDRAVTAGRARLAELEQGSARWAAAAVRLAHVQHWREEYDEAHRLFDAAEQVCGRSGAGGADGEPDEQMLAFVHQHRAKALFDEGRLDEALAHAHEALRLRQDRADSALIASTRQTLERIEQDAGRRS